MDKIWIFIFCVIGVVLISYLCQLIVETIAEKRFCNSIVAGQYYIKPLVCSERNNPWLSKYTIYSIVDVRVNDNNQIWIQFKQYECTKDKVFSIASEVDYMSAFAFYNMKFKKIASEDEQHIADMIVEYIDKKNESRSNT